MLPERYVPKKVAKMSKSDRKVALTGKILEVNEGSFVLDDESGKIEIFFQAADVEKDSTVQAFCTLVSDRLNLDVLQPLPGVDLNLLKTVDDLYYKAGV